MEEAEDTEEVSSSNSYDSSSSQDTQSPKDNPPSCRGIQVSLKGKVWMEMDNALVLTVDWRGRKFAGTLIKVNATDFWGPQRLLDYHRSPQKIKKYKAWKKVKTKDYGIKRTGGNQETLSKKYPRAFVDRCNIVESKLRYGRDKRVASYSSCPNSPKSSNSKNRTFQRSVSDTNTVSNHVLKRSSSFNLKKCLDQRFIPSSELSTLSSINSIKCSNEDIGTQCDEMDSTGRSEESMNEFDNKFQIDEIPMPHLSRNYIEQTDETIEENWNSTMALESIENYDDRMPNLQPIEPHLPRLKKVSGTCSANSNFVLNRSTDIF